ncbi:MAG: sulfotransferase [Bacteroidales bacterium]|nr:sulfotransferase [Bacteroidales bacterium]MCF8456783.1 sulfotransferase [Bacteroidales bacterium]
MRKVDAIPFFFIVGRARSGTTLLRTLFDAHPNVKIPLESPLIQELAKDYAMKEDWTEKGLLHFHQKVLGVKDFRKWGMDAQELKEKLLQHTGKSSFQNLINTIYYYSPTIFKKEEILLLGDKNPVYSINIKQIFRLYPEAKYIHLQRDHRAHILSMQKAGLYASDLVALAFRWKYSARKLSRLKQKHPGSFYSLRYEDLVKAPEQYLREMCAFLAIPYCPEVINYHELTTELYRSKLEGTIEDHHKRVFKPIDDTRVDSWKDEMSEPDIQMADLVVGRWAEKEGYKRQFKKHPLGLRLKVLPAILYQRVFYVYRFIYHKLPFLNHK